MGARDGAATWHAAAAAAFTSALPPPAVAGAQSTRAYRDIKGWIAALVHAVHAVRWAALAAAVERAMHIDGASPEDAACAVTRAIIERVVVRQPAESRRIVTSNARRQCARKDGRLSLIRLVDLALALAALRRAAAPHTPDPYLMAPHFWTLVRCLRGLRAVHEMDSTARSIDLCLLDSAWAFEHASDDAFSLDVARPLLPSSPDRATRTADIIQRAVLRASRSGSSVDRGPPPALLGSGITILTAAYATDFNPKFALEVADRCVDLTPGAVIRVRNGSGPLPLKDLRQALFCRSVMHALRDGHEIAFIMQKLAQLFVPVGWHRGGSKTIEGVSLLSDWTRAGNFSAEAVLGRSLAESGNMQGQAYLKSAEQKGDVAAPIVLGDLYRDGAGGFSANASLARQYYEIAIARGSALAALNLGNMILGKMLPDVGKEACKEAARLFQTSVDRGNARAALALADMLFQGLYGEARDLDRAERCYTIAVEKTTISMVRMRSRLGLARVANERSEISKAFGLLDEMLKEATSNECYAELDNISQHAELTDLQRTAYGELAQLLHTASAQGPSCYVGSTRIPAHELRARACEYCERAARLDVTPNMPYPPKNRDAWYMLGVLRLEMREVSAAISAFRAAMYAGHKHAPHNLGNLLLEHNKALDAFSAFAEGAARGDEAAAINAAILAIRLRNDYATAARYYQRATELGHASAPAKLAQLLVNSDTRDCTRARQLVVLARQRGHTDGLDQLAVAIDARENSLKRKRSLSLTRGARRRRRLDAPAALAMPIAPVDTLWGGLRAREWARRAAVARYADSWAVVVECARRSGTCVAVRAVIRVATVSHRAKLRGAALRLVRAACDVLEPGRGAMAYRFYVWRRVAGGVSHMVAFTDAFSIAVFHGFESWPVVSRPLLIEDVDT